MGSTGMHDMQSQPPHPRRPCSGTSGMGSAPAAACTGHRWGVRHSSRALSVSYLLLFAAGSLVCTHQHHKGSKEQAAGVRAGSEKGVAYHIATGVRAGSEKGVAYHIATDRPRLISSISSVRATGKEL